MDKDKTVKIRAYAEPARNEAAPGNLTTDKKRDLEIALRDAQLEEEKSKALENLKTIVQLRESLKQEQAKTAELGRKTTELETKLENLAALEAGELAKRSAQLEEEKRKSAEQAKVIEQLRESLRQEQAKAASVSDKSAELEAKTKELAMLEAKIKDLNGVLSKIVSIAEAGRLVSNA